MKKFKDDPTTPTIIIRYLKVLIVSYLYFKRILSIGTSLLMFISYFKGNFKTDDNQRFMCKAKPPFPK